MAHALALLGLWLSLPVAASAATTPPTAPLEDGFLVNTKLTYTAHGTKVETAKEQILPETNKGWIPLISPRDGVVLLGKMGASQTGTLRMEYMLVDTRTDSSVVSTPAILTRLGEETALSVDGPEGKVSIALMAKRTRFRAGK